MTHTGTVLPVSPIVPPGTSPLKTNEIKPSPLAPWTQSLSTTLHMTSPAPLLQVSPSVTLLQTKRSRPLLEPQSRLSAPALRRSLLRRPETLYTKRPETANGVSL